MLKLERFTKKAVDELSLGSRAVKAGTVAGIAVTVCILLLCAIMLCVGSIAYTFEDAALQIHTSFWKDQTVPYDSIVQAELREDMEIGKRDFGYGSWKLNLGGFQNDEFDEYTLYAYAKCNTLVVLHLKNHAILVIGGEDPAASEALYEEICRITGL